MEKEISFEQLPIAVANLAEELSQIKQLLIQYQSSQSEQTTEEWLDLDDLIRYDPQKRTKATWYSKISRGEVPYHKQAKKVYFLKSEIDQWLKSGKQMSHSEIEEEADKYIKTNRH